MMAVYTIPLPFVGPPLTLNQRLHWQTKRKLTRQVREAAFVECRRQRLGLMTRIAVELHYTPMDARRRDGDNLTATSKPAIDGLVDAGLVPDDTAEYVDHRMPVIDEPQRQTSGPRLYLLVTDLGGAV